MKIKSLIASLMMLCLAYSASAQLYGGSAASTIGGPGVGTIKLGAGLVYGTKAGINDDGEESGALGINIGAEYFFTEKISAAPSYTFFFPSNISEGGEELTAKVSSLNLDGRYYFGAGNLSFYGLAGLAVAFAEVEYDGSFGSFSESDNKTGLNLGAGLTMPFSDRMGFNAQIKYNTPLEQIALQAGVSFSIR